MPGWRRMRSCMPQKQPPASSAVLVCVVIVLCPSRVGVRYCARPGRPTSIARTQWIGAPPMLRKATPERLTLFSDGVFAVLITVLVLELRPPAQATYAALLAHWPSWLSYGMSYVFIAIVWMNHHYLLRYAREATPRLLWINFAHLFAMSLVPLSTAWMAQSKLAPAPVSFYA